MSLIDEALKRARMEAAQKAAEGEGLPYPTIPRHLGPPRRRGWLGPLIVALAVIAGLLVGAILATRGDSEADRTAALGPAEATTNPPAAAGSAATVTGDADPLAESPRTVPPAGAAVAPLGAGEPAAAAPTADAPEAEPVTSGPAPPGEILRDPVAARPPSPEPTGRAAPAGGMPAPPSAAARQEKPPTPGAVPVAAKPIAPPPAAAAPSPAAIEPAPGPPAPARQAPANATTVTDPDSGVLLVLPDRPDPNLAATGSAESFVQQVPLPAGGAIELGGIAWSETGPFALINGHVVGPGAVIDGYTLERIRPGHVVLSGDGRRIHLSLQ